MPMTIGSALLDGQETESKCTYQGLSENASGNNYAFSTIGWFDGLFSNQKPDGLGGAVSLPSDILETRVFETRLYGSPEWIFLPST